MITVDLKELRRELNQVVINQGEAIDVVSLFIFKHWMKRIILQEYERDNIPMSNLLLSGKSGVGKTFLIQQCCKLLDLPLIIIDAKQISQSGWHGHSLEDLLIDSIWPLTSGEIQKTVVLIDEFDKLCTANTASGGENVNQSIQYSLLKFMEGMKLSSKGQYLCNTKDLCFILAGSFSFLEGKHKGYTIGFNKESKHRGFHEDFLEDLINDGLVPELAGRISEVAILNEHTAKSMSQIWDSKLSNISTWKHILNQLHIDFVVTEESKDIAIKKAMTKKVGVRGLNQEMEKLVNVILNQIDINLKEIYQDIRIRPFEK